MPSPESNRLRDEGNNLYGEWGEWGGQRFEAKRYVPLGFELLTFTDGSMLYHRIESYDPCTC